MESNKRVSKIHLDIDRRNSTDIRIHPAMVMFVLVTFVCVSVYQVTQLSLTGSDSRLQTAAVFVVGIGVIISIMYLLTSRRYAHDERDMVLMRNLMEYTREIYAYYGITDVHYLNTMRSCIKAESGLRAFRYRFLVSVAPAAIGLIVLLFNANSQEAFVIVCWLFVISLVINLLLLIQCITYPRTHEKSFLLFSDTFVDAMTRCGIRIKGYEPVISPRPFIPYLLLSVITVGTFFIYWLYRSVVDMNRHFEEQWVFENAVMEALKEF